MLILSRRKNEKIIIPLPTGETIEICLCEIRTDNKVRIGVTAPPHIPVHREEVWERLKEQDLAS